MPGADGHTWGRATSGGGTVGMHCHISSKHCFDGLVAFSVHFGENDFLEAVPVFPNISHPAYS